MPTSVWAAIASGAAGGTTPCSMSPTCRSRPPTGVPLLPYWTRIGCRGSGMNISSAPRSRISGAM